MILIGEAETKREQYFRQAADRCGVPLLVFPWKELDQGIQYARSERAAVKIDPPSYDIRKEMAKFLKHGQNRRPEEIASGLKKGYALSEMDKKIADYRNALHRLEAADTFFLNTPGAIAEVLDKRSCKKRLQSAGVAATKLFMDQVNDVQMLTDTMKQKRVFSVFLKPVVFSGAAGVAAFRMHPHSGKMQMFTSCRLVEGMLMNTKTLYCLEERNEIFSLMRELLKLDVMAERWYPKASFHGKSFDLRVVYQFGHIAYAVARQAKGPITNLHLNNQALPVETIGMDSEKMERLEQLCSRAMACFPGLTMAGIDILLEKNSGKPYIIEMNGQGDLIYQDIYGENLIYREQVMRLEGRTG